MPQSSFSSRLNHVDLNIPIGSCLAVGDRQFCKIKIFVDVKRRRARVATGAVVSTDHLDSFN